MRLTKLQARNILVQLYGECAHPCNTMYGVLTAAQMTAIRMAAEEFDEKPAAASEVAPRVPPLVKDEQ